MPEPLTGYESDEEWARKTDPEYGKEWRQRMGLLGMIAGAILAGVVLFNTTHGMPAGKVRLLAGIAAVAGMAVGAGVGYFIGYLMDESFNPRTRVKRNEWNERLGRRKGKKKRRRIDLD